MKILILGGHGFIGHNVTKGLLCAGHNVTVVDSHNSYGEYPYWEYLPIITERIEYIGIHRHYHANVGDYATMDTIFEECEPEVVIDLATYPNAKMVAKNVLDATNNMVACTANCLELCIKYNVRRFVFASSSMVYGDFDNFNGPPVETDQCQPLTLYGSYKLQGENMCRIWHRETGLEFVILRPSAVYGVRDTVVRVISKMVVAALRDRVITVQGADNKLDFTNVLDVAEAFITAAVHPGCANGVFNCTRGQGRTLIEAATIVSSYIPCKLDIKPHDVFYPNRDTLDSSLLQQTTDWKPTIDIEHGIANYVNWFLSKPFVAYHTNHGHSP